jgi:sugar-specific transcriptional regulator TrmB
MKKVTDYLQELGLTEIEAKVYQGLLETGPTTVKELSEQIGIKRITTHFNVETLIRKGLVSQTVHGARRQILAEPPERLNYLIEQREKEILQIKDSFPDFLKTVSSSSHHSDSRDQEVEVKYYVGKPGVQSIYEDVLRANEVRAYVNSKEIAKVFPKNIELFVKTHNFRREMYIWEIMNKSSVATHYSGSMAKGRHFVKYVPETMNLSVVDYIIYDGKVAIINIKENPTGMIIINKDYYENAKEIFNFVWKMLPD